MFTLHKGDCLEYMKSMLPASVNCVITDPPYGIDFKYSMHDDNPIEYEAMMKAVIEQTERINKGMSFFWQAMLNCDKWHNWFPDGYRIFAACKNFVQFRPTVIQYSFDPVIFWGKNDLQPVAGNRDYHIGNTAKWVAQESVGHPCPRPLDTVSYILSISTKPGDTVFDPFMGSGTTGIACEMLGRNFIGCEIDPKYFAIAEKRIKSAALQPGLFTPSNNRLHWTGGDSPAQLSFSTLEGFTGHEADTTPPASQ